MKKLLVLCLLLLCCTNVFAGIELGFALDTGTVQDFFIKNSSYNFSSDIRCRITPEFEARVPVGIVWKKEAKMFEAGLALIYYPFEKAGFFAGLSLIQFGFVRPENILSENTISLNEVLLGWTFRFNNGIFIEPAVSIRDPSGTFADEYSLLKGAFPCYKTVRAHLSVGYRFSILKNNFQN